MLPTRDGARSQRLHRAHLRSVMLAKPLALAPLLLHHSIKIRSDLPRRCACRFLASFARSSF